MKKILLLAALGMGICANAQETTNNNESDTISLAKNELKVNAGYLLLGFPEVTYERILSEETSAGISVAASIDSAVEIDFIAIPYFRFFFGKKHAAGFFIEANAALYSVETYEYCYTETNGYWYGSEREVGNKMGAGLGFAIGGKFINKSGWIGELTAGIGRNFANTDDVGEVYPRLGVNLGKRF